VRPRFTLPLPGGHLALGDRTLVMGVLNVTPDSFSDGGLHRDPGRAIEAGLAMVEAGADLLDIGGESTRPGAGSVPLDEECRRVLPVVAALARQTRIPISIDTTKADVAAAALDAGAVIVNDVSGLRADPRLAAVAAQRGAGLVLMHTRGRPHDMQQRATYTAVVDEVAAELAESLRLAVDGGARLESIVLDPGIGFAKRAEHSTEVLARLDAPPFARLGRPWLVGPSRKSFLQAALGECPPGERDWGTAAAVTACVFAGAHIVRVHRVREMVQVVRVADMIRDRRDA
jgi:dihydropteroate synthase